VQAAWVVVSIVANLCLLARLVSLGIVSRYRWLAAYAFADALLGIAIAPLSVASYRYTYTWLASRALIWPLLALIARELYLLLRLHYPKIEKRGFTRWLVAVSAALAITVSCIPIHFELSRLHGETPFASVVYSSILIQRVLATALALFLVAISTFFSRLPTQFRQNVLRHAWFCGIYFAMIAINSLLSGSGPGSEWVNSYLIPASYCLPFAWLFAFTRAGETIAPAPYMSAGTAQKIERWNADLIHWVRDLQGRQEAERRIK